MTKIVLATRTTKDGYNDCIKGLERFKDNSNIEKIYIICNLRKRIFKIGNINHQLLFDENPIRQTSFNRVIEKLNKNKSKQYHLLTFSKEVGLRNEDIEKMINTLRNNLIVVGYRLKDNILSGEELRLYTNGENSNNVGIAYQVPWNTCALWNRRFVYGVGKEELKFDEICEKEHNQLGKLIVKVDKDYECTNYVGMEDGLAIAELVTKNKDLKYKLIKKPLSWSINENNKKDHKIKMARKNIVLSTFINIKGYSIDKLREAAA